MNYTDHITTKFDIRLSYKKSPSLLYYIGAAVSIFDEWLFELFFFQSKWGCVSNYSNQTLDYCSEIFFKGIYG